ncbi:MAG: glycosyltransferase family 2 protein [bacterium]|uniref:Glycosyl transferase family 2 n=2 Tax=Bacteria candidate phyla TaxID=1783234 RepID=A0A101I2Q0_UNCT6|nr:MAG: Glycosyl transferase family 2 [candidate division TA06 bacterium 32_111]KUK87148.1 MAG: Glycosyl transferase family 2 [candidate division TA06 bacterium 34_109]MDI6700013.1 glycosyltransferase family 2 protein [bacterium]HAF06838.1 glycosyltransferase family 2 protein [candidate division WOR-3 bacterium]HCP17090.1 glycosyltransferase family 2 protein [candidate division WOR-3 bacterium]
MKKNIRVSAMFPCYNDRENILKLVDRVEERLKKYTLDYEIIVVDDFSTDGARELLLKKAEENPKLKVILHERNMGYGITIVDGLKNAQFQYFFYTDGDGQYDPAEIEKLIKVLDEDTVLVNGYKILRNDPLYRIIIGKLYNTFMKFFFGIKLRDIDCDFRMIKKDIFKDEEFFSKSGTICIEMIKKIELKGCKVKEVGVNHYERKFGRSQFFNFKRLFVVFLHLIVLWYNLIVKRV